MKDGEGPVGPVFPVGPVKPVPMAPTGPTSVINCAASIPIFGEVFWDVKNCKVKVLGDEISSFDMICKYPASTPLPPNTQALISIYKISLPTI
ncbi:MAG: hypothetical protein EB119_09605 [Synechococcaceae bacterium WBB_34_004]|nr:hypothetical protein [Synechococcaceae bacterium WBB_34_004]